MDWGMKNRLSRIIKEDGKTVMFAFDHGYFLGPTTGLEDLKKIRPILEYADALMLTRGALRTSIDPTIDKPIVLRVSGGNSILKKDASHFEKKICEILLNNNNICGNALQKELEMLKDSNLSNESITVSMEEAIRLNVSAVAHSIYAGSRNEHETFENLGLLVSEAERYGIPVLAVTAVGKELEEKRNAEYLSFSCRVAAEHGAHLIKTYYCEGFEEVVNSSLNVPIVVAGGKRAKENPQKEAFKLAYNAIKKGAAGVDMGRNIFQDPYPVAMIKAISKIVHEFFTDDGAYEFYLKYNK